MSPPVRTLEIKRGYSMTTSPTLIYLASCFKAAAHAGHWKSGECRNWEDNLIEDARIIFGAKDKDPLVLFSNEIGFMRAVFIEVAGICEGQTALYSHEARPHDIKERADRLYDTALDQGIFAEPVSKPS